MKSIQPILISLLIAVCGTIAAQNAAGLPDLTFNTTGKVVYDKDKFDLYQDVQIQPDGKIVAVGMSMSLTYQPLIEVTRYLANGDFDPSFGSAGHFNYSGNTETGAYKCIIKDDGKILIGGYSTNYVNWGMLLLQLDENGILDPSFGNFGVVYLDLGPGEDMISAMKVEEDGKILVAGYSQDYEYKNTPVIARLGETGILDTSFGFNGMATIPVTETDNEFSAICVQSDGKIVAAGHISNGSSWFSLLLARFDPDGNLDPNYGTGGIVNLNLNNVDDEFFDMKLSENDEAILAGFTVTQSDLYYHLLVMKFDNSGLVVSSFGNFGKVIVGEVPYTHGDAMMIQTDGRIIVAGCTGQLQPGNNDWALWRFNTNGSPDETFGTMGQTTTDFFGNADEALGLALYEDKIIVAGKTRNATDYLDFAIAKYSNDNEYHLSIPGVNAVKSVSITPNLVKRNGIFNLEGEWQQSDVVSVELLCINGKSIALDPSLHMKGGKQSIQFRLPSSVCSGVYIFKLKGLVLPAKSLKLVVVD